MELNIEGDVSIFYSESNIMNDLRIESGWGGKQKTQPPYAIDSPTYWKGINLQVLLSTIAGDLDYNITVYPSDDYLPQNFSRAEIDGTIRTFNDANETLDVKAIPILAFEESNVTIGETDGPLRLVFVGENNQSILTISTMWVKHVDTIQISMEEESTTTLITTTTETSVETSSTDTTPKSSSSSTILISGSTLIFLILYKRRKKH